MKFSEMKYVRPDMDKLGNRFTGKQYHGEEFCRGKCVGGIQRKKESEVYRKSDGNGMHYSYSHEDNAG